MSFPIHEMVSEAESYATGYMIRGYHVYKDVWLIELHWRSVVRLDERSAKGLFGSGMHYSETESKGHRTVTHAAMTEFKQWYKHNHTYRVKICKPATNRRIHTNYNLADNTCCRVYSKFIVAFNQVYCILNALSCLVT